MAGQDTQVTIQLQQLTIGLIVFGLALLGFATWFIRSYWPNQMVKRAEAEDKSRKQALEKSENEIKHQRETFEEELAQRRQEREMERAQREREAAANNQILDGFLESSRNSITLSERYLNHAEKMVGELYGHRQVLTDVSETIDKIHADFEGLKTQMTNIALGVQNSTTASNANASAVNQMLQSIQVFGQKLDNYTQAAKGDTGKIQTMTALPTNGSDSSALPVTDEE